MSPLKSRVSASPHLSNYWHLWNQSEKGQWRKGKICWLAIWEIFRLTLRWCRQFDSNSAGCWKNQVTFDWIMWRPADNKTRKNKLGTMCRANYRYLTCCSRNDDVEGNSPTLTCIWIAYCLVLSPIVVNIFFLLICIPFSWIILPNGQRVKQSHFNPIYPMITIHYSLLLFHKAIFSPIFAVDCSGACVHLIRCKILERFQ